jgi:hypothetical protein
MMMSLGESDKQSADNEKKRSAWTQDTRRWDLGFTPECKEKVNETKQDSNVDGQ